MSSFVELNVSEVEVLALLACYAALSVPFSRVKQSKKFLDFPIFRDSISVPSLKVKQPMNSLDCLTLEVGHNGCL